MYYAVLGEWRSLIPLATANVIADAYGAETIILLLIILPLVSSPGVTLILFPSCIVARRVVATIPGVNKSGKGDGKGVGHMRL